MLKFRRLLPKLVIAIAGMLAVAWILYNLNFASPPSPDWALSRIVSSSISNERTSKGLVPALSEQRTRLYAVKHLSWTTVALYHDDQLAGFASFLRHFDGWQVDNFITVDISLFVPLKTVTFRHDVVRNDVINRSAEVIWGKRDNPDVSIVKITYDDGTVIEEQITDT
jgi:hypothetical protein